MCNAGPTCAIHERICPLRGSNDSARTRFLALAPVLAIAGASQDLTDTLTTETVPLPNLCVGEPLLAEPEEASGSGEISRC